MNRKKQGSLNCKILKHKTQRSLSKEPEIRHTNNRSPSTYPTVINVNQFIEHYQVLKQQYNFNLSSKNILEHMRMNQNSDDQFFFDVDLGVPYVESQHLDSGFEFEQKQNQSINFPKVSSAKEIFTSVLQISNHSTNQLDEENFTDQEEEEQYNKIIFSKYAQMKKKNRKQIPQIMGKVQRIIINEQQHRNQKNKKSYPINSVIQNTFIITSEKQNIMKKLTMTAKFRQEKLKFWNQRLVELQRSENPNKQNSRSGLISKKSLQFNSNENYFYSNNFSFHNNEPSKAEKNACILSIRKSKFQKQPTQKKINSKINVNPIKNKQNISPIKQKYQTKQFITKQSNFKKPKQIMEQNQSINPSNNKNFMGNRKQIILKNQLKSIPKSINLQKKVF